jgi:hypothetical protein
MYFDQKIFVLSENQVEAIKNKARSSAMMNMLKKIAQPEELPVKKNAAYQSNEKQSLCPIQPSTAHLQPSFQRKIHIGSDDIINLRIELALCNDVQEFIDKI